MGSDPPALGATATLEGFAAYGFALAVVALTTLVIALLGDYVDATDRVMLHLLGVIVVAFRVRLMPALLAALLSVASFDLFFVEPLYTFSVDEPHYRVTLVVMAGVGLLFSSLGAKLREQAREAYEAQLDADRERLRSSLLASVSHDLRTPLGAILSAVTTLEDCGERLEGDTRVQLLGAIHEQAELLARQLRNLLEMTRFEGGGLELERELGTLEEPLGVVLAAHAHRLGERRVEIVGPTQPLFACFDAVAVELVLSNLIDNALRHGEGLIEVRIEARGDELEVRVLDRGPGLDPSEAQRVFEKFYRGARKKTGSSGLGLAIVQLLVRESGGRVWARQRDDGRGAEFGFSLPRVDAPPVCELSEVA